MAQPTTPGLQLSGLQTVGWHELRELQRQSVDHLIDERAAMLLRPGPVVPVVDGAMDEIWSVHDDDTDFVVAVRARAGVSPGLGSSPAHGLLLTAEGKPIPLDPDPDDEVLVPFSDSSDPIPNDSTWYSVVVRAALTTNGRGGLSVTSGSASVVGVGTAFTCFAELSEFITGTTRRQTRIVVTGTSGNDGTYSVATVTDDEAMTTTETFLATEVIPPENWYVRGWWAQASSEPTDKALETRWVPEFEILPRVVTPAAGDFVLADVMRSGSTLRIVDRRAGSCAVLTPCAGLPTAGRWLAPKLTFETTAPFTANVREVIEVGATGDYARNASVAPSRVGGAVAVVVDDNDDLTPYTFDPVTQTWTAGAAIESGVTTAGVVALPDGLSDTHLCAYTKSGIMYATLSDDNGATWAGGSAIWDPTAVDAADTVEDPCPLVLQNGRIVVYGSYRDDSAAGQRSIRATVSDDYGASWDDNGGAGATVRTSVLSDYRRPSVGQTPLGRLWLAYEHVVSTVRRIYTATTATTDGTDWTDAEDGATLIPPTSTGNFYHPKVLTGAHAGVLVLFLQSKNVLSAGYRRVWCALIIGDKTAPMTDVLFSVDQGFSVDEAPDLAFGACHIKGGQTMIIYADEQTPKAVQSSRAYDLALGGPLLLPNS